MKQFIVVLALLTFCLCSSDHEKWQKFKEKHGKKYKDSKDEDERFKIFSNNLRKIENHNKQTDNGHFSHRLAVNQFADLTPIEFKGRFKKFKPWIQKSNLKIRTSKARAIPSSVDWREKGVVTPVKDQGDCSACWAFCAAAALECAHAIKYGILNCLSEQHIIDCDTEDDGCFGGIMEGAFEYLKSHPCMLQDDYPYVGWDSDSCRYDASKKTVPVTNYYSLPSGDEIYLLNSVVKQPICSAIEVTENMQFYESGIMNDDLCHSDIDSINHAVLIIGYGTEDGTDYWLAKNSWGDCWGESGYIKMSRNKKKSMWDCYFSFLSYCLILGEINKIFNKKMSTFFL